MTESERDLLIAQLSDSQSVAERRQAAKRLGELRDPAAISALVNAYRDENEDESVRRAAESALRIFRQMQRERDSQSKPSEPAERKPSPLIKPLTFSLAALVALNIVIIVIRLVSNAIGGLIAAQPAQISAASRPELIVEMQDYLAAMESEMIAFRQPLLDLQVNVNDLRRPPRCTSVPESQLKPRSLSDADARLNADLVPILETLNAALERFRALRAIYVEVCAQTNLAAIDQRLQPEGGAAGLVAQLDGLVNETLGSARRALEVARVAPPPTLPPTLPPPTVPVVPPSPTPVPVQQGAFLPTEPPLLPTLEVLSEALPLNAPIVNINYRGVRLKDRSRYRYRLAIDYAASVPPDRLLRGALSLQVIAENSATPTGRYVISLLDYPEVGAFVGWLPEPFYRQGNAFYTALNGIFYHTGAGAQTLCTAERFSPANIGVLAALDVDALIGRVAPPNLFTTWRDVTPIGGKPRYRADLSTQDADGVQINYAAVIVLALDGGIEQVVIRETRRPPLGYVKPLLRERTLVYTLQAADAALNLAEVAQLLELPCRTVTPIAR
ncbi:MAG: HEAT repeat domain-containing protein [Anaerolineae bacterium]|nr:HEAT repeat domain-containing protein [Anaerolineae bacterium]MDW8300194.1 HEAT repeat domain-containing protein [Anaerolineae bacterium]